jgi:hypothetical protein
VTGNISLHTTDTHHPSLKKITGICQG